MSAKPAYDRIHSIRKFGGRVHVYNMNTVSLHLDVISEMDLLHSGRCGSMCDDMVRTCMHTYIPACPHTCIRTYFHMYVSICIPRHIRPIHTYAYTYIYTLIRSYIHTFIHTFIHTYIHTYILTYIDICIYTEVLYVYVYTYMHICIYVYMYICIYAYMHICVYVYMYIRICMCIYNVEVYVHTDRHTHTNT